MARYGMIVDVNTCTGCMTCVLACKQENLTRPGVYWNEILQFENESANTITYVRNSCMQCDSAPCIDACKNNAITKREDGIVLIDQEKCKGDKNCINSCPYGAIFTNSGDTYFQEQQPFEKHPAGYRMQIPGKSSKCTLCAHRIDKGERPACVDACPSEALIFGDLDDPNSEISMKLKGSEALLVNKGAKPKITFLVDRKMVQTIDQRILEDPHMLR